MNSARWHVAANPTRKRRPRNIALPGRSRPASNNARPRPLFRRGYQPKQLLRFTKCKKHTGQRQTFFSAITVNPRSQTCSDRPICSRSARQSPQTRRIITADSGLAGRPARPAKTFLSVLAKAWTSFTSRRPASGMVHCRWHVEQGGRRTKWCCVMAQKKFEKNDSPTRFPCASLHIRMRIEISGCHQHCQSPAPFAPPCTQEREPRRGTCRLTLATVCWIIAYPAP